MLPSIASLFGARLRRGSFSSEVLQSFLTNLAMTGLTVLSGVLLARLLGPAGRGELAAIQALPLIVAALGQLGLNDAVIYFGGRDRDRVGRYALSAAVLILLAGVPIALASAWLAERVLTEQAPHIVRASQIFMVLLFVNAIDGVAISTARALHRIPLWNVLRVIPRVLWVAMVAVFFVAGIADPVRIALTYLALYLAVAPLLVLPVRRYLRGHWRPDVQLWPRMLRYGLPVAAGVAPRLLNQRIDQLIIAAMLPPRELGLYAVAVAWTGLAQLPAVAMSSVAFSKIAGMPGRTAQLGFIRRAVWTVAAVALLTAAGLALATPLAIRWVFGPEFVEAIVLSWILLVAVVPRSVTWMIQFGMQGIGCPTVGMYAQWAGLALLLPTAAALIPEHGAVGAAWALVAAGVGSLVVAAGLVPWAVRNVRG